MSRYGIVRLDLDSAHFFEITPEEYEDAKILKRNLIEALGIEQKLGLVLQNYEEYERELLNSTLRRAIFSEYRWASFSTETQLFNRRLINLLTTCRLYLDHISHTLSLVYGKNSSSLELLKQKRSAEYDSNLGYRVVEALRNYVQHRGLPVHGLQYSLMQEEDDTHSFLKYTVTPRIRISELREDAKFKRSVLKELEALGNDEEVDLKPLIRKHIESIGRIHQFIRELIADDLEKWDNSFLQLQERIGGRGRLDTNGFAVVIEGESGGYAEFIRIFFDLIEHRQSLSRKNGPLTHYSRQIITSEIRAPKA